MTFELSILVKATVILTLGLAAARLARRARASVRHLLLASTFGALLALPVLAVVTPALVVEIPVADQARGTVPERPAAPAPLGLAGGTSQSSERPSSVPLSMATALRAIWALGVVSLLGAMAASLWNLRRIQRTGIPWVAGEISARALARESGLRRHLTVILHERIAVPVTCGLTQPAIVLPPDAREWPAPDLQRAFVHELEHIRRADWWIHVVARAICAVYWFHPLVWIAWRQLGLESERACDDAVVRGEEGADYAEQLVTLAARLSNMEGQPMLSMANRSDLSVRVRALLDATQLRGRPGLAVGASTITFVLLVVAAIAPLTAVAVSRHEAEQRVSRQGPRVDAATRAINVALLEAAEKGDLGDVAELANRGADVNAAIDGDGSPLIAAARAGRTQVVRFLLDRGADPNLGVEGDGSPLIAAAGKGHVEIARMLLDRGAVVDLIVEGDENALITASGEGHLEVVKLLVSRGANVNGRAWANTSSVIEGRQRLVGEWRTPLNMAIRGRHEAVAQYLRSAGAIE